MTVHIDASVLDHIAKIFCHISVIIEVFMIIGLYLFFEVFCNLDVTIENTSF